ALGAGADHDVVGRHRHAELAEIALGDGLAKARQAQRGAVVRVLLVDRPDAGQRGVSRSGERAVADLQLDDVLALGLEALGDGEDVKGGLGGEVAGEVAEADGGGVHEVLGELLSSALSPPGRGVAGEGLKAIKAIKAINGSRLKPLSALPLT